ncbi:MAG: AAA family ATPase [Actinobacteria bacterium]|nr:AAA family ATPase [Actinomycetota bacterium]
MQTKRKATEYAHGKPFTKPLDEDIECWMKRVALKKPCIIVISGPQGEGKTTLAVEVADEANSHILNTEKKRLEGYEYNPIDLKKQLALGGKDFRKKLDRCVVDDHHVVIYDEAGDYSNIGFATKFNRTMNQVFNMNRAFSALIIVCLPEVDELSKKVLRSTRGLLRVHDRGENYSNFAAYDYKSTRYLVEYMKDRVVEEDAYQSVWPEYRGHFLNLTPDRERELDRYTLGGKRDIFHMQEIKEDSLKSTDEIAALCGRSKRWVQTKLKERFFAHTKVYKSRKYYSRAVVDALLEEIKNAT